MKHVYIFLEVFWVIFFMSCSKNNVHNTIVDSLLPESEVQFIIVVGQSNAASYAPSSSSPKWLLEDNYSLKDYYVWNKNLNRFQIYQLGVNVGNENNSDNHFGFDVFFAKKYIDKYKKKLLCIKQTLDSTPISEKGSKALGRWTPSPELISPNERNMLKELESKLEKAIIHSYKNKYKLVPVAILFHQGEADASEIVRLNDYEENFKKLIGRLRQIAGNDTIPVINGEIFYINENFKKINSIFLSYSTTDANFMTVNMKDNQTSIGDNLHYDARAHEYLGNKMFEYYEILK